MPWQKEILRDGLAQGYTWWFGAALPDEEAYPLAELPDGYLISSAEDMSHYLLAQINNGRYGNTTILSPNGIATMYTPAAPTGAGWEPHTAYAMGWYNGSINGILAIYHGGDSLNFHSDIFIEPQNSWGCHFAECRRRSRRSCLLPTIPEYRHRYTSPALAHSQSGMCRSDF